MKVQHFAEITIGYWPFKKRIGFLFDMFAWMNLWQNKGIDAKPGMGEVLYYAYVSWCKDKGKKVKLTGDQLTILIGIAPNKEVETLKQVLAESAKDLQHLKNAAEDTLKKK